MWRARQSRWTIVPLHLLLILAAAISLAPFAWLICASLKTGGDLFHYAFLPISRRGVLISHLTLSNYRRLFAENPFARWMINSIFLACAQTVISVTLSSLGGFALAKYRFAGQRLIMLIMLGTMLLPAQVLMPSSYELMYKFGWLDSYLAILVPGAVSVFGLILFRQAMLAVPDELLHAARIDGCNEIHLWWQIALPLVRPMIGAFTLLSFTATWNSFLWPQIVLQNQAKYTLPIGLYNLNGMPGFQTDFGVLMAATLLSVLPLVVLFFLLQRDFIAGLTAGAMKG
ncbi:MAG TPA: carbohydrate ABC transporter permease [Tepidisphaeraceae bacterium]|nr:carbohydrate ABC transporter permease [Tepidisphaeraceae bacterium]